MADCLARLVFLISTVQKLVKQDLVSIEELLCNASVTVLCFPQVRQFAPGTSPLGGHEYPGLLDGTEEGKDDLQAECLAGAARYTHVRSNGNMYMY